MGNYKNNDKKLAFIKKYNIKRGDTLTIELLHKARIEIGYSKTTTRTDIELALNSFIDTCK